MLTRFEHLLLEQIKISRTQPQSDSSVEIRLLIMLGLAHVYADRDCRQLNPKYTRELVELYFNTEGPPNLNPHELRETTLYKELRSDSNRLYKQATLNAHLQEGVKQVSDKLDLVQGALDQNAERRAIFG